jgi:hypothetical protein
MTAVTSFDHTCIDVFWGFELFGSHITPECNSFGANINNGSRLFDYQPQLDPRYGISLSLLLEPSGYDMRTIDEHHWLNRQEITSR